MQNNDLNLIMNLLSSGENPEQAISMLVGQNPQLSAILQQANKSGMSMKDFTLQYAKQNNINIQPLIDMMSKRGIK